MKKDIEKYRDQDRRRAYRRKYMVTYMKKYRNNFLKKHGFGIDTGKYAKLRKRVLEFLDGPTCVNCGCDIYGILEINHRNGAGGRHRRDRGLLRVLYDILSGRLQRDAVEVTCKVCNALHYVREILKIHGHTVLWRP
jgi:hypothetical protein